jgi:long-chain acyl-CoA synthetase
VQTTFPRLMLEHAKQRPDAPALREKVYGIWQTTTWAELALLVRSLACGLAAAGVQRDDHLVVVGENRPRLYAALLAAQSLGAVPVPLYQDAATTEYVFPINNADIGYAIVEDQEQVDKLLELREQCPRLKRIWFDDPRGLRNYDEPGLDGLDALLAAGQAHDQAHPTLFRNRSRAWPAAGRGGDVLHQRHHRQPQGCRAHAFHACWTVPPRDRPSTS